MFISRKGSIILLGIMICLFNVNGEFVRRHRVRQYKAKIMERPDEVPVVKCGDDIKLECTAEGEPTPDIEWWHKSQDDQEEGDHGTLLKAASEGRVKIKTERIFVVRSTLIIRDAGEADEGLYQCRASNSPKRKHHNINLLQHWKIEEAPVGKVMCRDTVMTHTEVFPASKYNESAVSVETERALTSLGLASSTTTRTTSTPSKEERIHNEPAMKTSQMTSSTTVVTVKLVKPQKPGGASINSVSKPKKALKRKISKPVIERETKGEDGGIGMSKNVDDEVRVNEATLEEDGEGGENSGFGIYQRSWLMVLLYFPIAGFVLLTSSY